MAKKPETLPALRPTAGQELALPTDLAEKAKDFASKSRTPKTLKEYGKFWRAFETWCDQFGRASLPTDETTTLPAYITSMAERGLAPASVDSALSAIAWWHNMNGFKLDLKNAPLMAVKAGIKRESAKVRKVRRVRPILNTDLREMLGLLRPGVPREAQDAAILALGWSGALRRSELVGLDLGRLGEGKDDRRVGYLKIDKDEMVITLMTSKASQDTAVDVVVPRKLMPIGVEAIETWVQLGKVKPGQPLFRGIRGAAWSEQPQSGYVGVSWHPPSQRWRAQTGKGKHLGLFTSAYAAHEAYCYETCTKPRKPHEEALAGAKRLHDSTVAEVIKRRVEQLAHWRNKQRGRQKMSPEEIKQLIKDFSGHSMRAGFVTTAADNDVDRERIKQQTRHKTDAMISIYIRHAGLRKKSGLEGIGV